MAVDVEWLCSPQEPRTAYGPLREHVIPGPASHVPFTCSCHNRSLQNAIHVKPAVAMAGTSRITLGHPKQKVSHNRFSDDRSSDPLKDTKNARLHLSVETTFAKPLVCGSPLLFGAIGRARSPALQTLIVELLWLQIFMMVSRGYFLTRGCLYLTSPWRDSMSLGSCLVPDEFTFSILKTEVCFTMSLIRWAIYERWISTSTAVRTHEGIAADYRNDTSMFDRWDVGSGCFFQGTKGTPTAILKMLMSSHAISAANIPIRLELATCSMRRR